MSDKPSWNYKLTIEQFKKLAHSIIKITHHWKFTGEDTATDWVELHYDGGKIKAPQDFNELFTYSPDHRCLFQLTYEGEKAQKAVIEIDKWVAKNKRDLAEYKRLSEKFKGIGDNNEQ